MLSGFVDIHHHLLYETDDGPSTLEQSIQMLQRAADQGVRFIAATPHVLPGHMEFDLNQHRQKLETLREYIDRQSLGITLCSGAEVLYTASTVAYLQAGRLPVLGDSWHLLVEFNPGISYDALLRALLSISNSGFSILLAHAERYHCLRVSGRTARLRERHNVKLQLNADAVIAAHRPFGDRWVRRILRHGLADVIASDAHNTGERACRLGDCARLIAAEYGEEAARRLCIDNPLELISEKKKHIWTKTPEEDLL